MTAGEAMQGATQDAGPLGSGTKRARSSDSAQHAAPASRRRQDGLWSAAMRFMQKHGDNLHSTAPAPAAPAWQEPTTAAPTSSTSAGAGSPVARRSRELPPSAGATSLGVVESLGHPGGSSGQLGDSVLPAAPDAGEATGADESCLWTNWSAGQEANEWMPTNSAGKPTHIEAYWMQRAVAELDSSKQPFPPSYTSSIPPMNPASSFQLYAAVDASAASQPSLSSAGGSTRLRMKALQHARREASEPLPPPPPAPTASAQGPFAREAGISLPAPLAGSGKIGSTSHAPGGAPASPGQGSFLAFLLSTPPAPGSLGFVAAPSPALTPLAAFLREQRLGDLAGGEASIGPGLEDVLSCGDFDSQALFLSPRLALLADSSLQEARGALPESSAAGKRASERDRGAAHPKGVFSALVASLPGGAATPGAGASAPLTQGEPPRLAWPFATPRASGLPPRPPAHQNDSGRRPLPMTPPTATLALHLSPLTPLRSFLESEGTGLGDAAEAELCAMLPLGAAARGMGTGPALPTALMSPHTVLRLFDMSC